MNKGVSFLETGIHNTSEIGRLKKVLLHRPGGELENLMPEYLERLLFDDIPYLKEAQQVIFGPEVLSDTVRLAFIPLDDAIIALYEEKS